MSVRELLSRLRKEVLGGNLTPTRMGEVSTQLSALLSNVSDEIRDAEMHYLGVQSRLLDELGKANRAEMKAKQTPEYGRLREAQDTHKDTLEMIRSLRRLQDTYRDEARTLR